MTALTTDAAVKYVVESILDAYEANGPEKISAPELYLSHLDEMDTSRCDMVEVERRVGSWLAREGGKLTTDTPLYDFDRKA